MRDRRGLGAGWESLLRRLIDLADADSARLYHTSVGLKARNQLVHGGILSYPFLRSRHLGEADPSVLLLSLDGLRDRYTLFGCTVAQSPHSALMKTLVEGRGIGDLRDHPYLVRSRKGTLDLRPAQEPAEPILRDSFERSLRQIAAGQRPAVKVIRFGGKRYVADGKHRAALAAVMGISVACEDVTPFLYDSFFDWMRRKMEEQPREYAKQLALLRQVEESRAGTGEFEVE